MLFRRRTRDCWPSTSIVAPRKRLRVFSATIRHGNNAIRVGSTTLNDAGDREA